METFIVRYKIKKGFVPGIKMWGKELSRRKKDVLETLKNEKVFVECAFIDSIAGENYLVYFMKCANIKEVFKKPLNNTCISTSKNDTIEVEKNY